MKTMKGEDGSAEPVSRDIKGWRINIEEKEGHCQNFTVGMGMELS